MNGDNKNSNQYSAADIQRYLKGQMSAEEMHAIETAALDDPFLADAIEGFEMAMAAGNEDPAYTNLVKLQHEFAERTQSPAKIVSLKQSRWWQISAAAVILLIIGIALFNNMMNSDRPADSKLAVTDKKQTDTSQLPQAQQESGSAPVTFADTQANRQRKEITPSSTLSPKAPVLAEQKAEGKPANAALQQKNTQPSPGKATSTDDVASRSTDRFEKAKKEADKPVTESYDLRQREKEGVKAAATENIARRNEQLAGQLNNFSGRVVDQNNKPVPYASLQVIQNKANLTTDQNGGFNFSAKDSVVDVQVGVVGFEQRNFRLQNNIASNNLVLEPANQTLDEVVVTGYGTQRKKDVSKTTGIVQNAVPQIGWIEYEKYLEKNKRPPSNNLVMKGDVVVSFEVKRASDLAGFKIEKSLSKDYDTEAIRLIKEGPAWKLLNGRKTRVTVIVKF